MALRVYWNLKFKVVYIEIPLHGTVKHIGKERNWNKQVQSFNVNVWLHKINTWCRFSLCDTDGAKWIYNFTFIQAHTLTLTLNHSYTNHKPHFNLFIDRPFQICFNQIGRPLPVSPRLIVIKYRSSKFLCVSCTIESALVSILIVRLSICLSICLLIQSFLYKESHFSV